MIKHIVMWNVRGDTAQARKESAQYIKGRFESLLGKIPGMQKLEIGLDESRVEYACDVVLYSEFDSKEALDAYANHPEHLRIRGDLGGIRITRHQVDYTTEAH
ncbi:Dabb family protein [Rhodoferax sp. GW822-FHT02A01]|uniref:Dabb family protein n=1 Tax=Rhodoferax sp. GW822-FHT02A01 TaxID=3141537 RepID=UPI00315CCF32